MSTTIFQEEYDPDYEPTQEEIFEYAQFLGMDLDDPIDKKLLHIAREGLKAELPSDWKPCKTGDQNLYYFNFVTSESTWDHPCDKIYKEKYEEGRERLEMETRNSMLKISSEQKRVSKLQQQSLRRSIDDDSTSTLGGDSSMVSDEESEGPESAKLSRGLADFDDWIHGNDNADMKAKLRKVLKSSDTFEEKLKKRENTLKSQKEESEQKKRKLSSSHTIHEAETPKAKKKKSSENEASKPEPEKNIILEHLKSSWGIPSETDKITQYEKESKKKLKQKKEELKLKFDQIEKELEEKSDKERLSMLEQHEKDLQSFQNELSKKLEFMAQENKTTQRKIQTKYEEDVKSIREKNSKEIIKMNDENEMELISHRKKIMKLKSNHEENLIELAKKIQKEFLQIHDRKKREQKEYMEKMKISEQKQFGEFKNALEKEKENLKERIKREKEIIIEELGQLHELKIEKLKHEHEIDVNNLKFQYKNEIENEKKERDDEIQSLCDHVNELKKEIDNRNQTLQKIQEKIKTLGEEYGQKFSKINAKKKSMQCEEEETRKIHEQIIKELVTCNKLELEKLQDAHIISVEETKKSNHKEISGLTENFTQRKDSLEQEYSRLLRTKEDKIEEIKKRMKQEIEILENDHSKKKEGLIAFEKDNKALVKKEWKEKQSKIIADMKVELETKLIDEINENNLKVEELKRKHSNEITSLRELLDTTIETKESQLTGKDKEIQNLLTKIKDLELDKEFNEKIQKEKKLLHEKIGIPLLIQEKTKFQSSTTATQNITTNEDNIYGNKSTKNDLKICPQIENVTIPSANETEFDQCSIISENVYVPDNFADSELKIVSYMLESLHSKKKKLCKQQSNLKKSQEKWRKEKQFLANNPTIYDYDQRKEILKINKEKLDKAAKEMNIEVTELKKFYSQLQMKQNSLSGNVPPYEDHLMQNFPNNSYENRVVNTHQSYYQEMTNSNVPTHGEWIQSISRRNTDKFLCDEFAPRSLQPYAQNNSSQNERDIVIRIKVEK